MFQVLLLLQARKIPGALRIISVATALPCKGPELAGYDLQALQDRTRLQNDSETNTAPEERML